MSGETLDDIENTPETIIGAFENGFAPSLDPEKWDRWWIVQTGKACPSCETAIGILLPPHGDRRELESRASEVHGQYPVSFPDGWTDGYDHPVYLYCDSPVCSWHGVAEWRKLALYISAWMTDDAPDWGDRLAGAMNGGDKA